MGGYLVSASPDGCHRLMTTRPCATADAARRTGPTARSFGRSSGLSFVVVVVILALTMAWGIHGLVDRAPPEPGRPPVVAAQAAARSPGRPDHVGTTAHPGLTVEGGYVQVKTPTFSALAVVNGPWCPARVCPSFRASPPVPGRSPFQPRQGTVPISVADFDSIDHPRRSTSPDPGARTADPLPTSLHTGQSLSFKIRAVMPTGEGLMRWAPDGNNIVAKWDYQVEND